MPKSRWSFLASLAMLTERPTQGITTYLMCSDFDDYVGQCRKLIPDSEIVRQPNTDEIYQTFVDTGEGHQIVIMLATIKQPQKPPSVPAVA